MAEPATTPAASDAVDPKAVRSGGLTTKAKVFIGVGAVVLGPVKIGNRVRIGANSFIYMCDIPDDATVVGSPARMVRLKGEPVDLPLPKTIHPDG